MKTHEKTSKIIKNIDRIDRVDRIDKTLTFSGSQNQLEIEKASLPGRALGVRVFYFRCVFHAFSLRFTRNSQTNTDIQTSCWDINNSQNTVNNKWKSRFWCPNQRFECQCLFQIIPCKTQWKWMKKTLLNGSMAPWLCGSMAVWLHGCVAPWLCGSMAVWLHCGVAPEFKLESNVTAIQPWSHTAIQPWGHTAMEPHSHGAIQPWSHTA